MKAEDESVLLRSLGKGREDGYQQTRRRVSHAVLCYFSLFSTGPVPSDHPVNMRARLAGCAVKFTCSFTNLVPPHFASAMSDMESRNVYEKPFKC